MKRIIDMSHEELIKMTDEDAERQVKIECLHQGVKMLPPPKEFKPVVVEKNDRIYEMEWTGLKSRNKDALVRISKAIDTERQHLITTTYNYKYSYDSCYVDGADSREYGVEPKLVYRHEDLLANADAIIRNKELKEDHDREKKEFDKAEEAVNEIREDVYSKITAAKRYQNTIDKLRATLKEYIELAGGDLSKAFAFFNKAYPGLGPDLADRVFEEYGGPVINVPAPASPEAPAMVADF